MYFWFNTISIPLKLLHIDLFDPTRTTFVSVKRYGLLVDDDYTRWTWVMFLTHNDESLKIFYNFCKHVQNEKRSMYYFNGKWPWMRVWK